MEATEPRECTRAAASVCICRSMSTMNETTRSSLVRKPDRRELRSEDSRAERVRCSRCRVIVEDIAAADRRRCRSGKVSPL